MVRPWLCPPSQFHKHCEILGLTQLSPSGLLMPLSWERFLIKRAWHFESLRLVIVFRLCWGASPFSLITSTQIPASSKIPGPERHLPRKLPQGGQVLGNHTLQTQRFSECVGCQEAGSHYRVLRKGPGTLWGKENVDGLLEISWSFEIVWKFASDFSHGRRAGFFFFFFIKFLQQGAAELLISN